MSKEFSNIDNTDYIKEVIMDGGESSWSSWSEESDDSPDGWCDTTNFKIDHVKVTDTTILRFYRGENVLFSDVYMDIDRIEFYRDSILIVDMDSALGRLRLTSSLHNFEVLKHIGLRVNGELKQSRWVESGGWIELDKTNIYDPWTPLPEPAVYGAVSAAIGFGLFHRRQRKS